MAEPVYPTELVQRLMEVWEPPHRRPLLEQGTGNPIQPSKLKAVLDAAFFASLRTEEGHRHPLSLVLVENHSQLTELGTPWRVHALRSPVAIDADRLAKLAPALQVGNRFLIVNTADKDPTIVGIGDAPDAIWFLSEDQYPRVRVVGPGDMVFYRGDRVAFRYQAGVTDELMPDFFTSKGEPANAIIEIGNRLSTHRPFPAHHLIEHKPMHDIIAPFLSDLIEQVAGLGHGGMIAILAPDDPDSETLHESCAYPIAPLDLGAALVDAYNTAMVDEANDILIRDSGPDYAPYRVKTSRELDEEAESQKSNDTARSYRRTVAGLTAVDGAVLLTHDLKVLGFGCKLPGLTNPAPIVIHAPSDPRHGIEPYDLTKRGTRHTSAAVFANKSQGRMAFTVSADGPVACFLRSPRFDAVIHWPVRVGVFATRW
ncbi:hypothetical protein EJ065_6093 [Corallococcus coralloides]|uniref:Probable sensor domain-containing protein n=1 Tax=Corallococcus coralloides TaxID=184914 RepID=A0A410S0H2_CORCK|nr:hypothetical protein [Corallococcus coralloides]QAT87622.1 hypothetical protein EJ065_6093 [Corallococcus coralloides]